MTLLTFRPVYFRVFARPDNKPHNGLFTHTNVSLYEKPCLLTGHLMSIIGGMISMATKSGYTGTIASCLVLIVCTKVRAVLGSYIESVQRTASEVAEKFFDAVRTAMHHLRFGFQRDNKHRSISYPLQ